MSDYTTGSENLSQKSLTDQVQTMFNTSRGLGESPTPSSESPDDDAFWRGEMAKLPNEQLGPEYMHPTMAPYYTLAGEEAPQELTPVPTLNPSEAKQMMERALGPAKSKLTDVLAPSLEAACAMTSPRELLSYVIESIIPLAVSATEGSVVLPQMIEQNSRAASAVLDIKGMLSDVAKAQKELLERVRQLEVKPAPPPFFSNKTPEYCAKLAQVIMTPTGMHFGHRNATTILQFLPMQFDIVAELEQLPIGSRDARLREIELEFGLVSN